MDLEFDKEIDSLLRQAAHGGKVVSTQPAAHLDADEISAFAENALPEKIKRQYTLHLADCDRCRKNLSSLILLNADEPSEIVHAGEKQFVITAAAITLPIPWYRRLFAFPNLTYAMGALVLVFSGIAAYVIFQSAGNSELSQQTSYEKQPGGKGMSSDGDQTAAPADSYSSNSAAVSNMMMSNAAMTNTANSAANSSTVASVPTLTANANVSLRDTADKNLPNAPKPTSPAEGPMELAKTEDSVVTGAAPPPPPVPVKENNYTVDGEAERQQVQAQNTIVQNQADIMTPDTRNAKRAPMAKQRAENTRTDTEESKDDSALRSKAASPATANVGGTTFRRESNVWYDSAYRGQPTINVTRGTTDYKKLDAGLRGIAENLGGTVVVVWKSKAYRIQ